jgi:hypothetical protein
MLFRYEKVKYEGHLKSLPPRISYICQRFWKLLIICVTYLFVFYCKAAEIKLGNLNKEKVCLRSSDKSNFIDVKALL